MTLTEVPCGYEGAATVQERRPGEVVWLRADPKVHVSAQMVKAQGPVMWEFSRLYTITGWCDEAQAYHADHIDADGGLRQSRKT